MKEIIRGCRSSSETENRFVMSSLSRYHSAPSTLFDHFLDPQQHKEPDRASEIINLLFSDDFAPPEASVLTRQRVEASHEYQGMIPRLASVDEHQILAVQEETFSRDSQDFQDFQESSYGHGGHSHSHSHGSHARVKSEQIELSQSEHVFPEFSIPNSGLNSCWVKKEHEQYEQFGIEKGISTLEIQSHVKMENKPARLGGLLRQTSSPADIFASYIPENRNTQDSVTRLGIPQFSVDPSSADSDMQSYATRKRFRIPELPLPPSPHQQQDHGLWLPPQASSPTDQFNCSSQFRAKRGFATHPRSVAERIRRSRISERIKKLQEVVPNLDKQTNTAEMLEEAVEYVKFLQKQVELLSNRGRGRATSLY